MKEGNSKKRLKDQLGPEQQLIRQGNDSHCLIRSILNAIDSNRHRMIIMQSSTSPIDTGPIETFIKRQKRHKNNQDLGDGVLAFDILEYFRDLEFHGLIKSFTFKHKKNAYMSVFHFIHPEKVYPANTTFIVTGYATSNETIREAAMDQYVEVLDKVMTSGNGMVEKLKAFYDLQRVRFADLEPVLEAVEEDKQLGETSYSSHAICIKYVDFGGTVGVRAVLYDPGLREPKMLTVDAADANNKRKLKEAFKKIVDSLFDVFLIYDFRITYNDE